MFSAATERTHHDRQAHRKLRVLGTSTAGRTAAPAVLSLLEKGFPVRASREALSGGTRFESANKVNLKESQS